MSEKRMIGGRYQLEDPIGKGGMGDVYKATDTETGQSVAIKVLRPDIMILDPQFVERFEREGEILRTLDHPNIVKVLAALEEDEQHYLVLEYVGGGSLQDLLREEGPLPVERVLEIALDLSDALTRAHRMQIIHRDIKPANVLLKEDGTPLLTDFGVARMSDRTAVTESGAIVGTYAYLSPEILAGKTSNVRSDIWAFGVLLFEMLTGERPFDGEQPAAILTGILSQPTPDLMQFRPDAPIALMGLIYWMLEKDPDRRVSSVRLVGAQLETLLTDSDSPLQAALDSPGTPPPSMTEGSASNADARPEDPQLPHNLGAGVIRQLSGPPRIFISYRQVESVAVTGRIYDRLVAAYGAEHIFKDVDRISAGADFKVVLEREINQADVQLVVIGENWLTVSDDDGQRRLDDAEDFVRIEVESGLRRDDLLLVPVLVNNAEMPPAVDLPPPIAGLAQHQAAPVRNDPDFHRDVSRLIEQINESFQVIISPAPRRASWIKIAAGIALSLIVLMAAFVLAVIRPFDAAITPPPTLDPTLLPTAQVVIAPGEVGVLVAQLDMMGDTNRNPTSFIVDDLSRTLESVPFSNIRVYESRGRVTSAAEASRIAEDIGASVVVWGSDDGEEIILNVQLGVTDSFEHIRISRNKMEAISNVRVRMTDPRRESVAFPVLGVLSGLYVANGDAFDLMRNIAVFGELDVTNAELLDGTLAADAHRSYSAYIDDPQQALSAINDALEADPTHPVLYISRSALRSVEGDFDGALQDARSAQRLGANDWAEPLYMLMNNAMFNGDVEGAIAQLNVIVELRGDDWFPFYTRGALYYLHGEYALARADIDRALELDPQANFAHAFGVMLALREGRISDAEMLIGDALQRFPNPTLGNRILTATFGEDLPKNFPVDFGNTMAAFGNVLLGQYEATIIDTEAALAVSPNRAELHMIQGLAYCNVQNYEAAEAAYSRAIESDPDLAALYLLRAEVREHLGGTKLVGALGDFAVARRAELGDEFAQLVEDGFSGIVTCENFLSDATE